MNKKVLVDGMVAGILLLAVSIVLTPVFNIVFPGMQEEYMKPGLFRPWTDPLMSMYFAYPFLLGLALSWIWSRTKKLIKGDSEFEKGRNFGLAYWVIAGIPGMFITYSSFQVSLTMVLAWSVSGLIDAILAGWVFAKRDN